MTSAISAATIASSGTNTTTVLTVLAQAAAYSSQTANTAEMAEIDKLIQNRLTNQIAALEPSSDAAVINALTSQISGLQAQQSSMEKLEAQYGGNANIFPGLQSLLAELQTYAASGNSSAFDTTLAAANVDVADLKVIAAPAPFQPDLVTNLKENGLGIGNSASYDLSTEAGQQAAEAAVSSAQTLVGQIFSITGSNQLLASDLVTSLTTQIGTLTSVQQQMESDERRRGAEQDRGIDGRCAEPGASDRAFARQHPDHRQHGVERRKSAAAGDIGVRGAAGCGGRDAGELLPDQLGAGDPVAPHVRLGYSAACGAPARVCAAMSVKVANRRRVRTSMPSTVARNSRT